MYYPLVPGNDGGHSIHLRQLGRRSVQLHDRLEGTDVGVRASRDDIPGRLETVVAGFGQRLKLMADAYIEAADIDAPAPEPPRTIAGSPRSSAHG